MNPVEANERLYVGKLSNAVTLRDIEELFEKFGRVRSVSMKIGYAFVDYADHRDASDAVYALNGREFMGERLVVELSHGGRNYAKTNLAAPVSTLARSAPGVYPYAAPPPPPPPSSSSTGANVFKSGIRTEHRIVIENIAIRTTWEDLRDLFQTCGEVCYVDAHRSKEGVGMLEFTRREDMDYAIRRYNGLEFQGRLIRVRRFDFKPLVRHEGRPFREIYPTRAQGYASHPVGSSSYEPREYRRRASRSPVVTSRNAPPPPPPLPTTSSSFGSHHYASNRERSPSPQRSLDRSPIRAVRRARDADLHSRSAYSSNNTGGGANARDQYHHRPLSPTLPPSSATLDLYSKPSRDRGDQYAPSSYASEQPSDRHGQNLYPENTYRRERSRSYENPVYK